MNTWIIQNYKLSRIKFTQLTYIICVIISLFFTYNAMCEELVYCNKSGGEVDDYEPENFINNNNLIRLSGQFPIFSEEIIVITGKVIDKNCMPAAGVKVYLWQANGDGKYVYIPLRKMIDDSLIDTKNESTFTGNGISVTDNSGNFSFITLLPGSIGNKFPYVNLRAEYKNKLAKYTLVLNNTSSYKTLPLSDYISDSLIKKKTKQNKIRVYNVTLIASEEK